MSSRLTEMFSVTSASPRRYTGAAGTRHTAARSVSRPTGPGSTRDNARGRSGRMTGTRQATDLTQECYIFQSLQNMLNSCI